MAEAPSVKGDAVAESDSYPIPDCDTRSPGDCVYAGFDPSVDGFSFANWGEVGGLGATEMVALFGRDKVCAGGSRGECVLYPAAQQWADQINEALAGGHCEGMAATSQLLYDGYFEPSDLDPAATTTNELGLDNPAVADTIEYWWATQMVAPVQKAYMRFHTFQPSEIAAELAQGLVNGTGYTLGIYAPQGAHGVTPIAVTNEGDKIAIHVYDNNFPNTVQRIMIDPTTEKWSYAMGSTNPDAPTGGWEGGLGTIELTPMKSRLQSPFPAPFDDEGSSKTSQLMVTSPDPEARLGIRLTIDGKEYDTGDPSVNLPAGVRVRPALGAVSPVLPRNWITVQVDRAKVGAFKATPVTPPGQAASIPVTMSIDDSASPRVTLRTSHLSPGSTSFDVARSGAVAIAASDGEVNIANGFNSANVPVTDGVNMIVNPPRAGNGAATIDFVNADGDVVGEYDVEDGSESGSVTEFDVAVSDDEGEFSFDVVESEVSPEEVDTAWLGQMRDNAHPSRDAAGVDGDTTNDNGDDTNSDNGSDTGGDTNSDNGSDTGSDSGGDTGSDTSSDTGNDTGSDSGGDTGSDSGSDSGGDSGGDSGSDTGGDSGGDTGSDPGNDTGGDPSAGLSEEEA